MPPTSARLTAPPCDDVGQPSLRHFSPPSPTRPPIPPRPCPLPWRPPILSQFFLPTPSRAEPPLPAKIRHPRPVHLPIPRAPSLLTTPSTFPTIQPSSSQAESAGIGPATHQPPLMPTELLSASPALLLAL
ncbi:hypothetical protein GQ55_7G016900 [Panicum hallii var. hallii]|uniref:Uncharacterized protein n=1 Tax=Panicum hallii var. hallii TaxID=1504633 RepID=A0A2T7CRU5_9POAL|nr:hypothetical protein GQ55_7G016900 [Panicum hallii var. hallii]